MKYLYRLSEWVVIRKQLDPKGHDFDLQGWRDKFSQVPKGESIFLNPEAQIQEALKVAPVSLLFLLVPDTDPRPSEEFFKENFQPLIEIQSIGLRFSPEVAQDFKAAFLTSRTLYEELAELIVDLKWRNDPPCV